MSEPIIDAWIQHPTPAFLRHEMFSSLRRWMRLDQVPDSIPLAFTLAAMDAGGVSRALVSAWWGPEGPLLTNDQVAEWVAEQPERLVGVAAVNLHKPMEAVAELRRCVLELGFRAVRCLPWLWQLPPNHRNYYPLYAACVDLGVPFCTQVGHAGPMMPSEPGRPIPYLDDVAIDFPELVIVGGHIGYPWTTEMIALATKYENVYIDTSAYKPKRYPPELIEFMRGPGVKKVLFGTNFPMISPSECMAQVDELELDATARRSFLHDNAARVFGL